MNLLYLSIFDTNMKLTIEHSYLFFITSLPSDEPCLSFVWYIVQIAGTLFQGPLIAQPESGMLKQIIVLWILSKAMIM
jgi:hypothetical protein